MRVLIVDNEIYLAGSIATKLADIGFECDIAKNVNEALKNDGFDIVLLSTTLAGQDFYPVIEKFKNSIIILLIAYISNDTVSKPIAAGADDYIQKPFMIEELVRKINHFVEHKRMQATIASYQNYTENVLSFFELPQIDYKKIRLPLLIKAKKIEYADSFVFKFMQLEKKAFKFIFCSSFAEAEKGLRACESGYAYICGIQNLSKSEVQKLFLLIHKQKVIISTTDFDTECGFEVFKFEQNEAKFRLDEIITIDEYIKSVITNYQDKLSDTELSKRLGISRKSLWEKRKKYEIAKKK